MHLSLPKWFPLFILASSVCTPLQCLISTLIQGGKGGHLFRLTFSVLLWGVRKQRSLAYVGSAHAVSVTQGLPPLTACMLSRSTLLMLQVALQGNCLKQALGCMHLSGLSRAGSGSQVLHKGVLSAGPACYALPRFEQLR